ncbi:MAG: hypothetical protein LAP86_32010 [Acidobacteriia bacterium]|nr:hypothetical protein [Terriglobia bacterium]
MENLNGNQNWLALYREAVLEPDRRKVKTRIAQAQAAIRLRAREMWYAGALETTERRQMDAASYFLGVLYAIGTDSPTKTNPRRQICNDLIHG